jgi:hypothetical protein
MLATTNRGRDATDVAIVTSFGPGALAGFRVITNEVTSADAPVCDEALGFSEADQCEEQTG